MTTHTAETQRARQRDIGSSPELRTEISRTVAAALAEDVGSGDATSQSVIPPTTRCSATIVARSAGVVAGLELVESVYRALPGPLTITRLVEDGESVQSGTPLVRLDGSATTLLTGERSALNFLGHLSGVATLTRAYVDTIRDTNATVLDTRKTTPGLRHSEKYAVRCGGGCNHRMGLYDAVLIKDNHLLLSGTLEETVARACNETDLEITVEVEDLAEVSHAIASGADRILLDNMSVEMMRDSVKLIDGRVPVEASGGVNLSTIAQIARTGVDFISVGSLTHSAPALDVSLEITP